jgi:hypothetical protein
MSPWVTRGNAHAVEVHSLRITQPTNNQQINTQRKILKKAKKKSPH